jgi:hypothetical protein
MIEITTGDLGYQNARIRRFCDGTAMQLRTKPEATTPRTITVRNFMSGNAFFSYPGNAALMSSTAAFGSATSTTSSLYRSSFNTITTVFSGL